MPVDESSLHCPLCGQTHTAPALRPGRRASCVRCGTLMAEGGRLGIDGCLALSVTGLLLCLPAFFLPLVTLGKFGNVRTVFLADVFRGFSTDGYALVGVAVMICGMLAPVALLFLLVGVHTTDRRPHLRTANDRFRWWTEGVQYWAMPEVQVLGVLVAFFKLGDVVDVRVEPGLYSYAAASLFMLLAWRCFKLKPRENTPARVVV